MSFNQDSIKPYQISLQNSFNLERLEAQWLAIERNTKVPIFLSWAWIGTWIKTYHPQLFVLEVRSKDQLVALALISSSVEKRHFVINSKQLRLNQTGMLSQDQIWVEYNDLISLQAHQKAAANACFKFLTQHALFHAHDEILISMIKESRAEALIKAIPRAKILFKRPCYEVNLKQYNKQHDYLSSLKSNTRYQIRRSIRHYEKLHGTISLEAASSTQQALAFFEQAAPFHIERWYDSGFKNPEFIKFHHAIILNYFEHGKIEVIKIKAGETCIAILYYLIHNQNVYFYLQGLLYESDKKLKPGLVAHAFAIQYFIDKNMCIYDFMGGYSQYKQQLAPRSEDLVTLQIQKPIFKFIFENTVGFIKNKLFRTSK